MCQLWKIVAAILSLAFVSADNQSQVSEYAVCLGSNNDNEYFIKKCNSSEIVVKPVIKYSSRRAIITCVNDPSWLKFDRNIDSGTEEIDTLRFENCRFADDVILIEIARLVGAGKAGTLEFYGELKGVNQRLKVEHLRGFSNVWKLSMDGDYLIGDLGRNLLLHLPKLRNLFLRNSRIKSIPDEFFKHVPNLIYLKLGVNSIRYLKPGTFKYLKNLKELSIWGHNLVRLDSSTFDDLISLESFALEGGNLELPRGIFDKMDRLTDVTWISHNLKTLPQHLFQNNKELLSISLQYRDLVSLPEDLFRNSTELEKIDLSGNNLKNLPPKIFHDLKKLKELYLYYNSIEHLPDDLFSSCENLMILRLGVNRMTKISSSLFRGLVKLTSLGMEKNYVTYIEEYAFTDLKMVKEIDLSMNNITDLEARFSRCGDISIFDVHNSLELLNLSFNRISSIFGWIQNPSTEDSVTRRKSEDLYLNRKASMRINLANNNIRTINLSGSIEQQFSNDHYKNISIFIQDNPFACDCSMYDFIRQLDNSTQKAVFGRLEMQVGFSKCSSPEERKDTFVSDLKYEIYECIPSKIEHYDDPTLCPELCTQSAIHYNKTLIFDCSHRNLTQAPDTLCNSADKDYSIVLNLTGNSLKNIPDLDQIGYGRVNTLLLSQNNITAISKDDISRILKTMESHENKIAELSINLSNNDITSIDLTGDFEQHFLNDNQSTVYLNVQNNPIACDCSLYDLIRYLDGTMNSNALGRLKIEVGSMTCSSPKELRGTPLLNLKSEHYKCMPSKIGDYDNRTLCPESCTQLMIPYNKTLIFDCSKKNLIQAPDTLCNSASGDYSIVLNLTGNSVKTIPSLRQTGYQAVKILLLSKNHITIIPKEMFPSSLEILELHDNEITNISGETLSRMNSSLKQSITLGRNPWQCNCEAKKLLHFIQYSSFDIKDVEMITCENTKRVMKDISDEEICRDEKESIEKANSRMIILCSAIAFLGLTIGALTALYYRYNRAIKVWLYAHEMFLWFVTEEELDKDKPYDAFISYSHKDEDFVVEELMAKLEGGPRPFKLCVHFRDWLAGQWIPDQIVKSVEDSRRTIFVVSPNFVKSEWGRLEFRTAHCQALKDRRARVIIILYGDIDPMDLQEPELKTYLSLNTYVKWGDPWFWDKLRYSLPHKSDLKGNTASSRISNRQHPTAQLNFNENESNQSRSVITPS